MKVGLLHLELFIPGSTSLKHKRMILTSLKQNLKNKFNISVAEVDKQDKHQLAVLAAAAVGCTTACVDQELDAVKSFIDSFRVGEIEIINLSTELL